MPTVQQKNQNSKLKIKQNNDYRYHISKESIDLSRQMLKTRLQNMAANPATVNLKQENKDKIWKTMQPKESVRYQV